MVSSSRCSKLGLIAEANDPACKTAQLRCRLSIGLVALAAMTIAVVREPSTPEVWLIALFLATVVSLSASAMRHGRRQG